MKLENYGDLRDAAAEAAQLQKKCEMELLAALEAMDQELVKDGLDLWEGARESLAHYLTQSIPAMGGATCYELLATGERARVIQLFNAMRYGIYLQSPAMQPNDTPSAGLPSSLRMIGTIRFFRPIKVAQQLHLELDELARKRHLDPEKLAADAESADIQELLGNLVRAFTMAAAALMSPRRRMEHGTSSSIQGKTAFDLVLEERTEDVIRYLNSIEPGFVRQHRSLPQAPELELVVQAQ